MIDLLPASNPPYRAGEQGNVLFYILIAVALIASLTFATTQSGRQNITAITDERQRLVATEIISYADTIEKAVSQLRLRGSTVSAISFAHPDLDGSYGTYTSDPNESARLDQVFNPAGGGVILRRPPSDATTTGDEDYQFLSHNAVAGIGTTCANASCSDLLLAVGNLRREVCEKINDLLGLPSDPLPEDDEINLTDKYNGTFGYSETIGDESAGSALYGRGEGCFAETGKDPDEHVYYKVLIPR